MRTLCFSSLCDEPSGKTATTSPSNSGSRDCAESGSVPHAMAAKAIRKRNFFMDFGFRSCVCCKDNHFCLTLFPPRFFVSFGLKTGRAQTPKTVKNSFRGVDAGRSARETGGTVPRFEWVNVVCVEVQIAHSGLVGSKRRGRERVPVRADVRQGSRRFVAVARSRAISNRWNGCRGEGTKQNSQFRIQNSQCTINPSSRV